MCVVEGGGGGSSVSIPVILPKLYYCMSRGVARIFQGGVRFSEILLTTPTIKNHTHYLQTKRRSV